MCFLLQFHHTVGDKTINRWRPSVKRAAYPELFLTFCYSVMLITVMFVNKKRIHLVIVHIFLAILMCCSLLSPDARADSLEPTDCSDGSDSIAGDIDLPAGKYNVYVRSPNHVLSKLYAYSLSCDTISAAFTASTEWSQLGTIAVQTDQLVTFYLYNSIDDNDVSLNRPSVLLLPEQSTLSVSNNAIHTTVDEQEAAIIPVQNDLQTNSLSIQYGTDIQQDAIDRVDYYVDNQFRFSKPNLQAFKGYLMTDPDAKILTRVIAYASGQTAILTESPHFTLENIWDALGYLVDRASPFLWWAVVLALCFSLVLFAMFLFRQYNKHRLQQIAYGQRPIAGKHGQFFATLRASTVYVVTTQVLSTAFSVLRIIVPIVVGGLIIISFIFDIASVNGHSMEHTITDKSHALVFKASDTLSKLFTGSDYVPKRGDVIIARTIFSASASQSLGIRPEGTIIKRVAGIPGDTITVTGDVITIKPSGQSSSFDFDNGQSWSATRQNETRDITLDVTLKPDEIFVVGDNRPGSIDSRIIGPLKLDQVIGQVVSTF